MYPHISYLNNKWSQNISGKI